MRYLIALILVFFTTSTYADSYLGAKYEATYIDWGKVESLDLDDVLGTTLNIFDIHYGINYGDRFVETGVFVSDTADLSLTEFANLAGGTRFTITSETEHSLIGARVGVGARTSFFVDALSLSATANARYAEQDVQLNKTTIWGSSTFENAVEGKESGFMADVGLGVSLKTGDAHFNLNVNGYVATLGDVDDMGSVSAGLTIPF